MCDASDVLHNVSDHYSVQCVMQLIYFDEFSMICLPVRTCKCVRACVCLHVCVCMMQPSVPHCACECVFVCEHYAPLMC